MRTLRNRPTPKIRGMAWLLSLVVLLLALPALAGEEIKMEGVTHIMNSSVPAKGNRTIHLEEVWRVGGDEGEDFFGMISQVRIGEDGLIYLLDTRLSEVPVYSTEGVRVNTLSREGDGPGETRIPSNMLFMPDGSLGLVQVFPGKIIKVQLQRQWRGHHRDGRIHQHRGPDKPGPSQLRGLLRRRRQGTGALLRE